MLDPSGNARTTRILERAWAGKIAALHAEALADDVLPALGSRFLRTYYDLVLESPSQTVAGVADGEELIGFCQVSWSPMRTSHVVLRRPSALLDIGLLALSDPRRFLRGAAASRYRPARLEAGPEIAFIAVKPARQGEGVGRTLVAEANRLAARRGHVTLVTKTSNEAAVELYRRQFSARVAESRRIGGITYHFLTWNVGRGEMAPECH